MSNGLDGAAAVSALARSGSSRTCIDTFPARATAGAQTKPASATANIGNETFSMRPPAERCERVLRGPAGRPCPCAYALRTRFTFAEPAGSLDRCGEVQPLVLRLLDEHHGLDGVDPVDPLLPALRRDLRLVRPVVELHLRDA